MPRVSKRRLEDLLAFWQPALRLADWDIEVKAATRKAMGGDDGENYAYPELREAEIRVVNGATSSRFADHETVLVHELVHCHLETIRTDENNAALETAIEAISKAIVALKRRYDP